VLRVLEPELLDSLEAHDPRALRARRDLRRVNALMGNAGIVARCLGQAGTPIRRIAEIGAGDGVFMLRVLEKFKIERAEVTLVDRAAAVTDSTLASFRALGWRADAVAADATEWLERLPCKLDALIANLFLHHLDARALERLLALAATRTRLFVACEPRRSALALAGSRMLWFVGCSALTRHDAVASVRAGFGGAELSALWPREAGSVLHESARGLFSHLFVARSA
jgi:hypothetical protein